MMSLLSLIDGYIFTLFTLFGPLSSSLLSQHFGCCVLRSFLGDFFFWISNQTQNRSICVLAFWGLVEWCYVNVLSTFISWNRLTYNILGSLSKERLHIMKPIFRNANVQIDCSGFSSKFPKISSEEGRNIQWLKTLWIWQ